MTAALRVGVVGVGVMGADHAYRLAHRVSGAVLAAVSDPDERRALAVGVRVFSSPLELIASSDVDAVLIASPGAAHEEQVLACLAAGKPVLCEKPLTLSVASAERLVAAEAALPRPLAQVGFMRRFDPSYTRLRSLVSSGALGRLLLLHNVHRNVSAPASFRSEMIVRDSLVHEVDVCRWLFFDEIASVSVLSPASSSLAPSGVQDPLVAIFRMTRGGMATTEVFVNSQQGYEVRCEAVGESGSAFVDAPRPLPADFLTRFATAYDMEVQAWVSACLKGLVVGPGLTDGLAATAASEAGVRSLRNGGMPVAP